jgi:hypothetical protein
MMRRVEGGREDMAGAKSASARISLTVAIIAGLVRLLWIRLAELRLQELRLLKDAFVR